MLFCSGISDQQSLTSQSVILVYQYVFQMEIEV